MIFVLLAMIIPHRKIAKIKKNPTDHRSNILESTSCFSAISCAKKFQLSKHHGLFFFSFSTRRLRLWTDKVIRALDRVPQGICSNSLHSEIKSHHGQLQFSSFEARGWKIKVIMTPSLIRFDSRYTLISNFKLS